MQITKYRDIKYKVYLEMQVHTSMILNMTIIDKKEMDLLH